MPQGDYIELHQKRHGVRLDKHERERKRAARLVHDRAKFAQQVRGLRAKLHHERRHKEKIEMN